MPTSYSSRMTVFLATPVMRTVARMLHPSIRQWMTWERVAESSFLMYPLCESGFRKLNKDWLRKPKECGRCRGGKSHFKNAEFGLKSHYSRHSRRGVRRDAIYFFFCKGFRWEPYQCGLRVRDAEACIAVDFSYVLLIKSYLAS